MTIGQDRGEAFDYDVEGNLRRIIRTADPPKGIGIWHTDTFRYDRYGNVISKIDTNWTNPGDIDYATEKSYKYDTIGMLLEITEKNMSWEGGIYLSPTRTLERAHKKSITTIDRYTYDYYP
ncbi:MAG TPA: hypothetical protein VKS81_06180 [Bacteroidota bacterium]|nr:hypothetical protein [Bacteroidota bacterium]